MKYLSQKFSTHIVLYTSKLFDLDVACNRVGENTNAWMQKSDGESLVKSRRRSERAIKVGCEPVRRMKRAQNHV